MVAPVYTKPLAFSDGQILGRAHLGILRDNDDFFNALADRWRPIVPGWESQYLSGGYSLGFDGWHLLSEDAQELHYWFVVTGYGTTGWVKLIYNWGGDQDSDPSGTVIATASANGTYSGTYDLVDTGGFSAGLYRVAILVQKGDGNPVAQCRAPFTVYDLAPGEGGETYTAGHSITDGLASDEAHFNRWRTNDDYFWANRPYQVAVPGMKYTWKDDRILFDGYDKFHPDHLKIWYGVYLSSTSSSGKIRIYYDYDEVITSRQYTEITDTSDPYESSWTITDNGYVKGDWYRVLVQMERTEAYPAVTTRLDYIYITAASLDSDYTVMDPLAVNQWVYGDTAGQDTRIDLLTDNDAAIYDRLTWAGDHGRMDIACWIPEQPRLGDTDIGDYRLKRAGDTLYYRTTGAELVLPDGSTESLNDWDESNAYYTLDLNTLDLPYGSIYQIKRVSNHWEDEGIYFAWER